MSNAEHLWLLAAPNVSTSFDSSNGGALDEPNVETTYTSAWEALRVVTLKSAAITKWHAMGNQVTLGTSDSKENARQISQRPRPHEWEIRQVPIGGDNITQGCFKTSYISIVHIDNGGCKQEVDISRMCLYVLTSSIR